MFENTQPFVHKGAILSSKIRKFIILKNNKEVERNLRMRVFQVTSELNKEMKLIIELTNDNNPSFLYKTVLTNEDYRIISKKYKINIEFENFPTEFINLLDEYAYNVQEEQKFKLLLDGYSGGNIICSSTPIKNVSIKIIQKIKWRNDICILNLSLNHGTHEEIQEKLETEIYDLRQCMLREFKLYNEKLLKALEEINDKDKVIEQTHFVIDNLTKKTEKENIVIEHDINMTQEFDEMIALEKNFRVKECEMEFLTEEELNFHMKGCRMELLTNEKERCIEESEMLNTNYFNSDSNNFSYYDTKVENLLKFIFSEEEFHDSNAYIEYFLNKLKDDGLENTKLSKCLDESKKELLKSKEMISELQNITKGCTNQIKINREVMAEQELLIKIQEEKLEKQVNFCQKLEEELNKLNRTTLELKLENEILQNNLQDKDIQLSNIFNIVNLIKNNLKDRNLDFKQDISEQSLLFYRAFLSMPSLLPSDDYRRMDELWYPRGKDTNNTLLQHLNKNNNLLNEKSNIIVDTYVSRYSKRFGSIPTTLFKSSEIPITVLSSPDGALTSQPVFGLPEFVMINNSQYEEQLNEISKNEQIMIIKKGSFQEVPSSSISFSSLSSHFQENKFTEKPLRLCSSESTINSLLSDEKIRFFGFKKASLKHVNRGLRMNFVETNKSSFTGTGCHSGTSITKSIEEQTKIKTNLMMPTGLATSQQRGNNLDAIKVRRTFSHKSFKSQISRRSQNSQLSLCMSQDTDSGIFNLLANCNLESFSYSSEKTNKSA